MQRLGQGTVTCLVAVGLLLLAPATAYSDEAEYSEKKRGIFVNPLGIAFGVFGAEYDHAVAERVTLNSGLSYFSKGNTTAVGFGVGVQWFVQEKAFHRFWIMPKIEFAAATAEEGGTSASSKLLAVGALLGWQWTWDGGTSVRLGGGALYYAAVAKDKEETVEVGLDGVAPALDLSIGYTF